jgi:hypothetical protein
MKNPDKSEVREKILSSINKAVNEHVVPALDKPILDELQKWEKKLLG